MKKLLKIGLAALLLFLMIIITFYFGAKNAVKDFEGMLTFLIMVLISLIPISYLIGLPIGMVLNKKSKLIDRVNLSAFYFLTLCYGVIFILIALRIFFGPFPKSFHP